MQVAELIRVSLGLRRDIPVSKVVFISFDSTHRLATIIINIKKKFRRLSQIQG